MLEQAQQMQAQLMAAQAELAETTVEGSAGGVAVTLTGTGELTAVTVSPGTFDGADAESLADLGDLVVAAYRDAKGRADELAQHSPRSARRRPRGCDGPCTRASSRT